MLSKFPMTLWRSALLESGSVIVLLVIAVFAHWQLVVQGLILADYDAFIYFYTNREYTAARLLDGQLPLWNPYVFAGTPHLANPQSAVFYPGTWLFLLFPTPYAYTANLFVHTVLAGAAMSAFTRSALGASRAGGLAAGVCYMLSGAFTAHLGHLNQLSAAALLPTVLLTADRAVRGLSARWAMGMATLLGVQLLAGHPQVTYMTVLLVGVMLLWQVAATEPRRWGPQVALISIACVLAVGLSAIQIIPTIEATRLGIRSGGLSLGEATASSLPPELLPLALLPGYSENPPSTEFLGFVGVVGLVLALLGAVTGMAGRHGWLAGAAALSLVLSLGNNTGVFESLFHVVPGLDSFRVPARWLLPWTVCLSGLVALALGRSAVPGKGRLALGAALALFPVGLATWAAGLDEVSRRFPVPSVSVVVWWVGVVLTFGLWWVGHGRLRHLTSSVLVMLLAGELLVARMELPFSHAVPSVAWRWPSPTVQVLGSLDAAHRVMSIAGTGYQPESTGIWRERYPDLTGAAFDQLLTAIKWSDTQAANISSVYRLRSVDGYDGGVFPMRRFVLASSLFHPQGDVRPDGVLVSSLDAVPRATALDLFAVRAVVASFEKDVEVRGLRFDRAVPRDLAPGEHLILERLPDWRVERLAMLVAFSVAEIRHGDSLLEVIVTGEDGRVSVYPLAAGGGVPFIDDQGGGGGVVPPWRATSGLPPTVLVELPFPGVPLERIQVRNVSDRASVHVGGITVAEAVGGHQEALLLDPALELWQLGDTRVYFRADALPRAFLVHDATVASDDDASVAIFDSGWSPRRSAFLPSGPVPAMAPAQGPESAVITVSRPEDIRVTVQASTPGLLVLSDAWYPGWHAEIDGQAATLLRANIYFRAVAVPAGQHEVRFVYDPAILRLGATVTALALLMTGLLWLFGPRLQRMLV